MNSQKIVLFGTSGEVSQRLVSEALKRGHTITAVVREEKLLQMKHPNLTTVKGDMKNRNDVTKYSKGHDVVICAHGPLKTQPQEHIDITRSVIEGTKNAGLNHLLFAAHPLGLPTENTEEFYNSFKPIIQAQREALRLFKNEKELHWGYAHSVEPEFDDKSKLAPGRFPRYTFSDEILLIHQEGESRIPVKNYTSAIIDEVEKGEPELHGYAEEEGRED
jgi:uncharacterized protein